MKKINQLKNHVKKSWKWVITISIVSILFIGAISIRYYYKSKIDSFYDYNVKMQESFRLLVEHSLDTVRYASYNAFYTKEIEQLRNVEISNYQAMRSVRILNTLAGTNPFIHSIYVYNHELDTVFTTNTGTSKGSEFYDKEAFASTSRVLQVRLLESNHRKEWVYSLTFQDSPHKPPSMIVNIDAQLFNASIFEDRDANEYVYVPYANHLFSTNQQLDQEISSLTQQEFVDSSGYFVKDGQVLFYAHQPDYDLYFLRVISANSIENRAISFYPLLAPIIVSTIFALIALSFFIKHFYHKPLYNILDKFEIENTNKQTINHAISFWIEDQKKKIAKGQVNMKINYLKNHITKSKSTNLSDQIQLKIDPKEPLTLTLFDTRYESLILALLPEKHENLYINDLLFVISHELNENYLRTYANTRKIVICHSNLTHFENLPNTHQNLVELYNLRILYQDQYYFTEQDLPISDFNFDELIKLEQEYFNQLGSAKPSTVLEALDNWSWQVQTIRFNSLIFFYNKLYIAIYELFEKRFPSFKVLTISEFENKLNLTQNINYINDYLRNITVQYCDLIQKEKDQKQQQLSQQVQMYISENLKDPNLTPDSVAEHFDFNSTYLSRLFKQYFDLSISDYILEMRLHEAKQLLIDTNHTVKDISQACGIINTNYFFTLFKKHFGETPSQYRQSHKET